nr:P1 protein [Sorghum mosaic virus]
AGAWKTVSHKWKPDLDSPRDVRKVMEHFAAKHQTYDAKRAEAHNAKRLRRTFILETSDEIPKRAPIKKQVYVEKEDHNPTQHLKYEGFDVIKNKRVEKPVTTSVTKLIKDLLKLNQETNINIELVGKKHNSTTRLSLVKKDKKVYLHCKTRHKMGNYKRKVTNIQAHWESYLTAVSKCYGSLSHKDEQRIRKGDSGITYIRNGALFIIRGKHQGKIINSIEEVNFINEIDHF